MAAGEVVVTVEHCHDCAAAHGMSTKHDAAKYARVAAVMAALAEGVCAEVLGPAAAGAGGGGRVRTALVRADIKQVGSGCRVGALEVQVAMLDEAGVARVAVLHSKLASGHWPRQEKVARALRRFLADDNSAPA
jgi:hypothetical protein